MLVRVECLRHAVAKPISSTHTERALGPSFSLRTALRTGLSRPPGRRSRTSSRHISCLALWSGKGFKRVADRASPTSRLSLGLYLYWAPPNGVSSPFAKLIMDISTPATVSPSRTPYTLLSGLRSEDVLTPPQASRSPQSEIHLRPTAFLQGRSPLCQVPTVHKLKSQMTTVPEHHMSPVLLSNVWKAGHCRIRAGHVAGRHWALVVCYELSAPQMAG